MPATTTTPGSATAYASPPVSDSDYAYHYGRLLQHVRDERTLLQRWLRSHAHPDMPDVPYSVLREIQFQERTADLLLGELDPKDGQDV